MGKRGGGPGGYVAGEEEEEGKGGALEEEEEVLSDREEQCQSLKPTQTHSTLTSPSTLGAKLDLEPDLWIRRVFRIYICFVLQRCKT